MAGSWSRHNFVGVPEISTLSLHLPATPNEIYAQIQSVSVASADKNLLVLSTGPQFDRYSSSGRYLVYDTATDVHFLVPPIDLFRFREIFGCRPVIVRRGDGCSEFILAQVLLSNDTTTRHYYVAMWSPFASEGEVQEWGKLQDWVYKEACLPDDVVVKYPFMTDVVFAFQSRWACWVDLNFGMVTCDLLSPDLQLYSKLLPDNCVMSLNSKARGRPDIYSTMSCVEGEIRFLYMEGYADKKCPRKEVTISTWTLRGQVPAVWLPQRLPICPVLSPVEPHLVYFFLSDIDCVDGCIMTKGEHVLGLNLQTKQVQSWSKCPPGRSLQLFPYFIATDLCCHQKSSNLEDQGNVTQRKRHKQN
ncbi:hypothetical protein QOZ80_3BG0288650 [Eleusine coracana subsp. coracana]|nr:hypothetical protein QOZ80_3BG0288650 [Eleusine coracana subsp. coracana]